MDETTSPEFQEFLTEEHRLLDIVNDYPEPVTFSLPSGGATILRQRIKRAFKNILTNPSWPTSLDRNKVYKILSQYTFTADGKHSLYCGFPRRTRTPQLPSLILELPIIKTEDPAVLHALLLLKNLDHIPVPIKIETSLPVHELKQSYYNTEIADSIFQNQYQIV